MHPVLLNLLTDSGELVSCRVTRCGSIYFEIARKCLDKWCAPFIGGLISMVCFSRGSKSRSAVPTRFVEEHFYRGNVATRQMIIKKFVENLRSLTLLHASNLELTGE